MADEDNPFAVGTSYDPVALVNDLQSMCRCEGSGFVMDHNGSPTDCENVSMHSYIAITLSKQIAEGHAAVAMQDSYVKQVEGQRKWIDTLTSHLDAIARIANERPLEEYQGRYDPLTAATAVITEIRKEVNSRHEEKGLSGARASIMREMAQVLHKELDDELCICGERWNDLNMCSEQMRIFAYADRMETGSG